MMCQIALSDCFGRRHRFFVACAAHETKPCLSPSAKQRRNPFSGPPPVYKDLSARHDWPVKQAIKDLPIKIKGNSKCTSGNSSSPLAAQNKDISAALQTLLTEVTLRLRRRLTASIVIKILPPKQTHGTTELNTAPTESQV